LKWQADIDAAVDELAPFGRMQKADGGEIAVGLSRLD
jgi:hypothetical protein